MKTLFLFFIAFFFTSSPLQAQEYDTLILHGTYQDTSIYVLNPSTVASIGGCTDSVVINGRNISVENNRSAFEIDLSKHGFRCGDSITVYIFHDIRCIPKILNPELITPVITAKFDSIYSDTSGLVYWHVINESHRGTYIVEQFLWDKWVRVATKEGVGLVCQKENSYEVTVPLNPGTNRFRIKKQLSSYVVSDEFLILSDTPEVEVIQWLQASMIRFKRPTYYEILTGMDRELVKSGVGDYIKLENLPEGAYFIRFGLREERFVKR